MDPDARSAAGLEIELAEQAGDWSGFDIEARIGAIARALPAREPDAIGVVAVALANDATVQDLNARFRGKDKPTNVLSFPSEENPGPDVHLGDIILAAETLRREAAAEVKSPADHFTHLVVHGILHVLGYDHESVEDAERMERLETRILADMGIEDPYAEPASDRAVADSEAR
jgi:probable rRNA maturation factor